MCTGRRRKNRKVETDDPIIRLNRRNIHRRGFTANRGGEKVGGFPDLKKKKKRKGQKTSSNYDRPCSKLDARVTGGRGEAEDVFKRQRKQMARTAYAGA